VLRWLSRLFRQREAADAAAEAPPPLPTPPPAAVNPTRSDAPEVAVASTEVTRDEPVERQAVLDLTTNSADADGKETCPTCGRTSVFAGPPGQRFCTYCALRDELFERSAAATE
jgi:hypothetical protein